MGGLRGRGECWGSMSWLRSVVRVADWMGGFWRHLSDI